MCGITASFLGLATMFAVSSFGAHIHFKNTTCPTYTAAPGAETWNCMTCLQVSSGCGFCAVQGIKTGACLTANLNGELACINEGGEWFTTVCPIKGGQFSVTITFTAYLMLYSSALGTVPWVVNSEVYMLRYRGICAGMAAVANWFSYLIMIVLYLSYSIDLGHIYLFLLLGLVSFFLVAGFHRLVSTRNQWFALRAICWRLSPALVASLAGSQDSHEN